MLLSPLLPSYISRQALTECDSNVSLHMTTRMLCYGGPTVRFMFPTITPSLAGVHTARKGDTQRPARHTRLRLAQSAVALAHASQVRAC